MVGEALGGIAAFKTAFDIARGLKDMNDAAIRNAAVIDLQEKILSAQQSHGDVVDDLRAAKEELQALKSWEKEKVNYKLTAVGEDVFVYEFAPAEPTDQPSHKLCARCFNDGKKSVLQKQVTNVGRWDYFVCDRCDAKVFPHGGGSDYLGRNIRR